MHAHFVLAHPEAQSFNGHLVAVGAQELEKSGWTTSVSDLYALGFDPCERGEHYRERILPDRFDAQAEQRHASKEKALPDQVVAEIEHLDRADLVIFQYPMWWHLPPAMLKGYLDRVFSYGEIYTSRMRFEEGRFAGRKAMVSVTVGTSENTYAYNGRSGDIDLMLWPVNFSLAYVGYTVLEPFVAYGVEAALRYSADEEVAERLKAVETSLQQSMRSIENRDAVPFNQMSDWGKDGKVVASAPAYSPYIRHREKLDLI